MAKGVQADRDTHRVRGPDRGAQQDEPGHRPGSGLDGAAAPDDGAVRPHLAGLPVYKMTGSGNDFVMVDGRASGPAEWSVPDIRAVCARGTGIGADGLVFVAPGAAPGVVRMAYFNSDGSRAAMCGNAALCSTQLAARLGLANGRGMSLETDAGTYERGVEAETLACGTGAVAAACAIQTWGLGTLPATIWTRSGRTLEVRARQTADGGYEDVWLVGEARLVFRGVIA